MYEILQTPDGYLWLRTSAGLVRFDGVRFVLMDPVVGNEPVKAICKSADGDLLIRTTSRTVIYKNGAFSDYLPPAPLPDGGIRVLFQSKEHEVFVGADDFIYLIQDSGVRMLRRGTAWISAFLEDQEGMLWIGGSRSLYTYRGGALSTSWDLTKRGSTNALTEDHEHNLWVGTVNGLYRMNRERSVLEPVKPDVIRDEVNAILEDPEGSLWVGTSASGLLRLSGGHLSSFNSLDGLTDSRVLSLYEDREGSLWVGTASGLDRFRNTKLTTLTTKEGLPSNATKSVIETRDGSLYIFCDAGGLGRINNGVVTAITKKDGLPNFYGHALFESKDGSLWIGAVGGLTRYKDGKFVLHKAGGRLSKPFISAINEDEESLIVTTSETLALRFKNGEVFPFTIRGQTTPLSAPGNYTFTIYRDPSGTLWFGTVQGLFKFAKGEPPEKARQNQIDFPVASISDDQQGSLWLGGRTPGLVRFRIRDGRVTRYTKQSGLFDDYPTKVLPDDAGNLWISTTNGIYVANRKDLDDFADGRTATVRTIVYGTADGMKTSEAASALSQPGGWRTRDGRLWFATRKGVVVVDPKHLPHNDLVPPVVIESVVVDGDTLSLRQDLQIAPGKDNMEFHYTSLSLRVPARVRFKYQLEGYDRNWVDAGTRRVAYYTNLPPGKYRFRVIASNDDGVWNETGASVSFVLKPHVYQTGWFYGLSFLAVFLCAIGGQRLYTRHLHVRAEELTRIVDERTKNLQEEIAERKRAEAALEQQRKFLRQVIDISPNFIFVKDREGRFTLINQALADAYSQTVEEITGKTDQDISLKREEAEAYRRDDLEVLDTMKEKVIPEETNTDSQGRVHWLQTVKRPIASPDGKSVLLLGVAMDITERKRAEQQLHLQATALESAGNAIVITDRRGIILWVNAAFTTLTGYPAEEAVGQNPRILQSGEHPRSFYEDMWKNLLAGQIWRGEIVNRRKDGQLYTEEMTITPVKDDRGEIAHFVAIKQDVTEQRALERQLRQAQKMEAVGQLAGGVAHDFHNLMGVILGYSEIMEEQFDPTDPNRKKVEQMHKAAIRAVSLTGQLLAFSRQQLLQPVDLNLNASVADMEKMLSRLIGEDIQVVTSLQPHLGHVKADPSQIEQVLMNLAVNSRDAMPRGGKLTIETAHVDLDEAYARQHAPAQPGPYVMLAVSDTGMGMDKETQAHMFEPFFTTKGVGKGTGLGLSTVYGIVKQSGGYIWVYSEPGRGSTFKIYLPRIERRGAHEKEEKSIAVPRGSETILLVEDSAPLLELAREFLETCGYHVLSAGDPLEAIRVAEQHEGPIPLLITDVVMPEMSGRTLAEKLTAIRPAMRVLYMSGYTNDTILRYGAINSSHAFLQKPFTRNALATKVRDLLGSSTS